MGTICTKEKCPECGADFQPLSRDGTRKGNNLGLVCPRHLSVRPQSYYIQIGRKWDKVYSDSHGKPLTSFRQAVDVQAEIDALIRANKFRPEKYKQRGLGARTVASLMEDYLDPDMRKKPVPPSYMADYRRHLKAAAEYFNDTEVQTMDEIDIDRYAACLKKNHPDWRPKTLRNYVDDFRAFMHWAAKKLKFVCPDFPCIQVPDDLEVPAWVDRDEQAIIAAAAEDDPIVEYILIYGHRPCMARALKVMDVDRENLTITANRRRFSRNTLVAGPAKNGKVGILPIMPDEHPRLARHILDVAASFHPEAFLFTNPRTGQPYTQDTLNRLWKRIKKKLNIKDSVLFRHVARHSVASMLLNQGHTFEEIGALLCVGPEMLRKYYGHHDVTRKRAMLSSMMATKIDHFNNIRKLDRCPNVAPASSQHQQ